MEGTCVEKVAVSPVEESIQGLGRQLTNQEELLSDLVAKLAPVLNMRDASIPPPQDSQEHCTLVGVINKKSDMVLLITM